MAKFTIAVQYVEHITKRALVEIDAPDAKTALAVARMQDGDGVLSFEDTDWQDDDASFDVVDREVTP